MVITSSACWAKTDSHTRFGVGSWGRATCSERIERAKAARDKIARMIADGEEWLLPIFIKLRDELLALEKLQSEIEEARLIASNYATQMVA